MGTHIRPLLRGLLLAMPAALLLLSEAHAQRPAHYEHANADLVNALELYSKAKYGAAAFELDRVIERIADPERGERIHAEFHRALCAVRLFNDDAGQRLEHFIAEHPESQHVPIVRLELFRHAFNLRKWKDALAWSDKVDRFSLDREELEEYRFKRGYAYFQTDDRDRALGEFSEVKEGAGIYATPALYYASHIHYERGQYETALQGFERLKGDEAFGGIVPFYIAEILFLQGKYDALDAYVKPMLADPKGVKRINEINRLAGEANYRNGRYEEALPYLQKSAQRSGVDRSDRYILGYTYYRTGDCRKALAEFNLVANGTDSIVQLATYHMADCYLKLNEKNYARNAFKKAYELGNDPKVTEDALFQYAKLAYELSFDPYHEAINALQNYLKAYPNTPRRDEAYEFLLNVYLRTKNYEAALAALDEIKNKDLRLREAYQRLAYDRGVELYEGRQYASAVKFFERALVYPVNQKVNALAHYWMAESHYGAGDMQAALRKYNDLRNSPGAYATDLYEQAGYGMGYTFFKMKNYEEAVISFRRFVATRQGEPRQRADAMMRIGDSYFVTRDNANALKWYSDAALINAPDKDYAMYQKGVVQGLVRDPQGKIATLRSLLSDRPDSRYAADAKYQLAETYINQNNDADALRYYGQVIEQHPNSPHVRQSMLQRGLVYQRQGNTEQALSELKGIVTKYPTMDGSKEALTFIESIYVQQGRVSEWETYLRSLKFVDPATFDLDEKYFRSAEMLYNDGKCAQAIGSLGDYLNKYPKGAFAINARFYRGDCHYRDARYDEALPDLEAVIQENAAQFLESALFGASDIHYRQKRWEGARVHFARLEEVATFPQNKLAAQVGQMRCLLEMGRPAEAAVVAARVSANTDANADLKAEAGLVVAKAELDKAAYDAAYNAFKAVSAASTNALGAEAKYFQCYVRYLQGRHRDAEKEVFEFVKRYPAYDHWKARCFILLGDVYVQLGDLFQAKATLQSVADNSTEPELVEQARQRLRDIQDSEAPRNVPSPQEDMEITLPGNSNGQ
ncbi:MAG: tetratricopeptide repeat protein [Flavobacteriales bacterium]|nr:tetratricopeptide repeat protein [Flavobacteriales bacterium]